MAASGVLEQERLLLEEVEQLRHAAATALLAKPSGAKQHRAALLTELRIAAYALQAQRVAVRLQQLRRDVDGSRRAELTAMGFGAAPPSVAAATAAALAPQAGSDALALFYARLADMHEYHQRHAELSAALVAPAGAAAAAAEAEALAAAAVQAQEQQLQRGGRRDIRPAWMLAAEGGFPAELPETLLGGDASVSATATAAQQANAAPVTAGADLAAELALAEFGDDELFGRYVDLSGAGLFDGFCGLPGVREARFAAASSAASSSSAAYSSSAASAPAFAAGPQSRVVAAGYAEASRVDYAGFLRRLHALHATLPLRTRVTRQYRRHICALAGYLARFLQRRHPLVDADALVDGWLADFEAAWAAGTVQPAWASETPTESAAAASHSANAPAPAADAAATADPPLRDLSGFASEAELLAALGAEGCRLQLRLRGLKQGGSADERAARLFSVRAVAGVDPAAFPKKLRAPVDAPAPAPLPAAAAAAAANDDDDEAAAAAPKPSSSGPDEAAASHGAGLRAFVAVDPVAAGAARLAPLARGRHGGAESHLAAAWADHCLLQVGLLLEDVLRESRRRAEKRQTRTVEEVRAERQAEREEALGAAAGASAPYGHAGTVGEAVAAAVAASTAARGGVGAIEDDEDDDDDKPVHNPLNLPLGWDGKPIPYWLYKLHGLNLSFACEICGGESYKGRRDFDRHFQEPRHAQGMRSLGIPNTKHFHDITRIADAQALFAKLCSQLQGRAFRAEDDEEFQDSLGNVLNKRTFMDLSRQGLL